MMRIIARHPLLFAFSTILLVSVTCFAMIFGPTFLHYRSLSRTKDAYQHAAITQLAIFRSRLIEYRSDVGSFPSTSQGLESLLTLPVNTDDRSKWKGPYIARKSIILDPWGNHYRYRSTAVGQVLIWSLGPDSQDGTGDDIKLCVSSDT